MIYRLLSDTNDNDLSFIRSSFDSPSIARFIGIDPDNYWRYVTQTDGIYFYKIFREDRLVGTVHCETDKRTLYLSVVVFEDHQNKGIGFEVLCDIIAGKFDIPFDVIRVSIDEDNAASIRLFEKSGFIRTAKNDELYEYEYIKAKTAP